jgi:tricorn protease
VTKRITNTSGQERTVSFSPDGRRLVFAAEYNRAWGIYEASIVQPKEKEPYFFNSTVIDIHPILENGQENFQPSYSPDGKEVAYLENRTTLKILNLDTKLTRVVLSGDLNYSYEDGDQWYDWSPDGRWFLVNFLDKERWNQEAGMVDSEGKQQLTNLTKSGYSNHEPQWLLGGKSMIWFSDRDGLRAPSYSGETQIDVYQMFFTQEAFDRSKLSKAENEILKEKEGEGKKKKESHKDEEKEGDEPKKAEPIAIDLNNLEDRTRRLTLGPALLEDATSSDDGETLVYLAKSVKGHELWSLKIRDRELKRLCELEALKPTSRGPGFPSILKLDKEGKNAFVLVGGRVFKVKLDDGKAEPVKFNAEKEINGAAERSYLFEHIWRQVREKFYEFLPRGQSLGWEPREKWNKESVVLVNESNYSDAHVGQIWPSGPGAFVYD